MLMDICPEFQWHHTKDKKVMRPLSELLDDPHKHLYYSTKVSDIIAALYQMTKGGQWLSA